MGGFFTFGLAFPIRDEIDFELLSNDLGHKMIFTNVFEDDDFSEPGDFAHLGVPGLDLTQFAEYEIRWLPDRVQWYIDGALVREELGTVPDDPSEVRLNIWAPDAFFTQAFNAALQPATTNAANQEFELEIDFVEVTAIPVPRCPWDINGNGSVDVPDLLALLAAWGTNPGGPPDFDGDGMVAVPDLLALLAAWGPCL